MTWLKLRHRTLYTANKDRDCPNPKCLACKRVDESMKHLAECNDIRYEFWWDIINLMRILKIKHSNTPIFIILGITETNEVVCKEGAAILAIGRDSLISILYSDVRVGSEHIMSKANNHVTETPINGYGNGKSSVK